MKVAAYQASLQAIHSLEILKLIRKQIDWCEVNDVELLCCPEAVLGEIPPFVKKSTIHEVTQTNTKPKQFRFQLDVTFEAQP